MTGPAESETPIFASVARDFTRGPAGRHHWREETRPVARHGDDDHDGVVNQADEDWRPDARDDHAHDDAGCDQAQQDPDRWIGATRDPDVLAEVIPGD